MLATRSLCYVVLLCVMDSVFGWVSIDRPIGRRPFPMSTISSSSSSSSSLNMGVTSTMRRVRDSLLSKERTRNDLKIGIAGFYDRSSKLWEDVWGEVCGKLMLVILVLLLSFHSNSCMRIPHYLFLFDCVAHAPRILHS